MTPFLWFKDVAVAKTLVSESEYCCVWSRLSFLFGIHGIFTESLLVRGLPTLTVILLRIKPVYVIHQCYTNAFCHFSAALCLSFSRGLLSYVCSALRHKIWVSKTFTLDKACDKRSFTDLLFFSAVTVLASASYSREFRDLSTAAQASALLAVVSCINSICLKRGLEDSGTWVIDSLRWRSPA